MLQSVVPKEARWIAPADEERIQSRSTTQTAYFKAALQNDGTHETMLLHISANQRYCLYVNGIPVLDGPCKGDLWHQYCDVLDIKPYCKPGENIVGVKVAAYPAREGIENEQSPQMGPCSVLGNAAGSLLILWCEWTDAYTTGVYPWLAKVDDAVSWRLDEITEGALLIGGTEEVSGEKLAHVQNWARTSDANGFSKAVAKWGNGVFYGQLPKLLLYERPIPYLLRERFELPEDAKEKMTITVEANTTREILLDMGRLTTCYVMLRCENGKDAVINLLYSEGYGKRDERGRLRKWDRCDDSGILTGISDIYHAHSGLQSYSPFWFRTFRFIKLTIQTASEAITLHPLELTETRFPLKDKIRFNSESNEHWLRPLWDISLRTLQLCMHETYEDCPFYEQLQYTMDTRLQILFTYAVSNDASMARRTLFDYHSSLLPEGMIQSRFPTNHAQIIPAFALHWILMLKDYVWETGDLDYISPLRFTLESILDWFKRKKGALGLTENHGYWDFADWTNEWSDLSGTPRAVLQGPSTIHNLVYAYTLQEAAVVMDLFGLSQIAGHYRNESDEIISAVNRFCWSNERQMYREGPHVEEYSQHAQIFAVLSGAIKAGEAQKLMEKTLNDTSLVQCSFVWQFYLFRALEKADAYEKTQERWPLWKELLSLNLSTVPEIPGSTTRSDCHAWGALLLHELPRLFLGVSPLLPGYKRIKIKPMGYFIQEIEGEVPTPHGAVTVSWCYEQASGCFSIKGHTPVEAEIYLPNGSKWNVAPGEFKMECH